jgi:hypothetical protein
MTRNKSKTERRRSCLAAIKAIQLSLPWGGTTFFSLTFTTTHRFL